MAACLTWRAHRRWLRFDFGERNGIGSVVELEIAFPGGCVRSMEIEVRNRLMNGSVLSVGDASAVAK